MQIWGSATATLEPDVVLGASDEPPPVLFASFVKPFLPDLLVTSHLHEQWFARHSQQIIGYSVCDCNDSFETIKLSNMIQVNLPQSIVSSPPHAAAGDTPCSVFFLSPLGVLSSDKDDHSRSG
jgi:hypothetical protein